MSIQSPFGQMQLVLLNEITKAGGMATREGREMVMTSIFQQYLEAEARNGTLVDEVAQSLFRMMGRVIVQFSATVSVGGLAKKSRKLETITDDMMGFLDEYVDAALAEYRQLCATGGVTITHVESRQ